MSEADQSYLSEWVRKAEEDFEAATALARQRKHAIPNAVCFHCQQCAEKYLKAYLVQSGVNFPKTHDLRELRRLALTVAPMLDQITDPLIGLTPYGVELRYPGQEATVEEAREAMKAMRTVRRFVRSRLRYREEISRP